MTLNDTVADMLNRYPTLFQWREDCLHQLYLVNGNGYDWIGGELVAPVYEPRRPKPPYPLTLDSYWDYFYPHKSFADESEYMQRFYYEQVDEENRLWQGIQDNFEERLHSPLHRKTAYYPICRHACIMTMPDNIKEAWLAGALEMSEHIRQLGPNEVYCGREDFSNARNQAYLPAILMRIEQIKQKRGLK